VALEMRSNINKCHKYASGTTFPPARKGLIIYTMMKTNLIANGCSYWMDRYFSDQI